MDRYFNERLETLPVEETRKLQLERLKHILKHTYSSNNLFRDSFEHSGIKPEDITSLDDLSKLPFMNKDTFREAYPLKLSCTAKENIREMHMSSGSTGTPVVMPYTERDLDQWAECMARCYVMSGARTGSVVQITPTFGLFNGGFGMFHGARKAGLFIVPTGSGNTPRQIRMARDLGTEVLTGVVSYGLRVIEELQSTGIELPDLKIGIFGAEIFSEPMKKKLCKGLGIDAFDIYGMTETGGVGTLGMDCRAHEGLHVWEDHYIVEVVDPGSGKPLPDGELGELTITSLSREALPVVRYRTGDLTRIVSRDRCVCGRTHLRIASVTGRVDDMLIVKGVNFFPSQVEHALMSIPGIGSHYQIIIDETEGVRDVTINVEAEPGVTGFTVEKVLKEALGFSPRGDVYPIGSLPRQEGKAKRVFYKKDDTPK